MNFRGKKIVFAVIVATLLVPPVILVIPNYMLVSELGWLNSLIAIIVPTAASAFGVGETAACAIPAWGMSRATPTAMAVELLKMRRMVPPRDSMIRSGRGLSGLQP